MIRAAVAGVHWRRFKRYVLAQLDPSEDRGNAERLIALVVAAAAVLIVLAAWCLFGLGSAVGAAALLGVGCGVASLLALIRTTGRTRPAAHVLAALTVTAVSVIALVRGGFHPQVLMWLVVIPVCGNLIADFRRVTIFWSVICVIVIGVFYGLAASGRLPERVNLGPDRELFTEFAALALFVVTATLASIPVGIARRRLLAEKKEIETQLVHAQKLESLGQLAGGIAHDLNNVLMVIQNAAHELEDLPADHPGRRAVEDLGAACERAVGLTGQLRIFARYDRVLPEVLDVAERVGTTTKLLDRALGSHVTIEIELADELHAIEIDPQQFDQVLMNLILNARDAMPEGGRIRICLDNVHHDVDGAKPTLVPGRYVQLSIADEGTGIPEHARDRVFEPFFTTKERGVGTGLGLATCSGIVERAGGSISFESSREGTTFFVLFPASGKGTSSSSRPIATRSETEVDAGKRAGRQRRADFGEGTPAPRGAVAHILLVEDEQHVRKIVARTLTRQGYSVTSAANGRDAIAVLDDRSDIDLVLTDVVMPEVGGDELATELARRHGQLRVTFMSGYTGRADAKFPDGAAVLEKPFTRAQLLEHVEAALRK